MDLYHESFLNRSDVLYEDVPYYASYLSPPTVVGALTLLQAELNRLRSGGNDGTRLPLPVRRDRVERVLLSSMYVCLLRWQEMQQWAIRESVPWPIEDTAQAALSRFRQIYERNAMDCEVGVGDCDLPLAERRLTKQTRDCGLNADCNRPTGGLQWLTNTIRGVLPPPEPCPSSECGDLPPGRRSFPASVGINPDAHPCGWNQHPSTSFGDRIFVAGSSKRGPFVCCNVSSPLRNPSAKPGAGYCKVGADGAVGCWWPISAHPPLQPKPGCPNVSPRTVCPVSSRARLQPTLLERLLRCSHRSHLVAGGPAFPVRRCHVRVLLLQCVERDYTIAAHVPRGVLPEARGQGMRRCPDLLLEREQSVAESGRRIDSEGADRAGASAAWVCGAADR